MKFMHKKRCKNTMNIEFDSELLNLVTSLETDVNKAVNEGLTLWLKEKMIICPITKKFCINPNCPCNNCDIAKT